MPFFPTRSAPKPLPISLVKPAEKLQPESGLLLFSEFHWHYEMVKNQGRNCHGWQFQEKRARMPFFRPVRLQNLYPFH